jgi:hypothetical protein
VCLFFKVIGEQKKRFRKFSAAPGLLHIHVFLEKKCSEKMTKSIWSGLLRHDQMAQKFIQNGKHLKKNLF